MSVEGGENEYFDSLCELDQAVQANHEDLQETLAILQQILDQQGTVDSDDGFDDDKVMKLLDGLAKKYDTLLQSSVDMKYAKYESREAQLASHDDMEDKNYSLMVSGNTSESPFDATVAEYVTVMEAVQRNSLEYINLLEKMSLDIAKQVEVSNTDLVSKYDIDNWMPLSRLQGIIDKFSDTNYDTLKINDELKQYMEEIKLARARYTIENQHILKGQFETLNKEVNYWRREWDNIEMMMFGDKANSIKSMLSNIESMKTRLVATQESANSKSVGTNRESI